MLHIHTYLALIIISSCAWFHACSGELHHTAKNSQNDASILDMAHDASHTDTSDTNASDFGFPDDMPSGDQDAMTSGDMQPKHAEFGLDIRPTNTTCIAPVRPRFDADVRVERVWDDLSLNQPIAMIQDPLEAKRWYIVQQHGVILRVNSGNDPTQRNATTYLDIRNSIRGGGERGLLGMAFHPDYAQNRKVFLSYTYNHPQHGLTSRISRVTEANGLLSLDNEEPLFELEQPYGNHNGGHIEFGLDGLLYISFGDGGDGGDPLGHGQNTHTALGTILRIDIDRTQGDKAYGIPQDNPFAQNPGAGLPEIYAWGLRNVWKFHVDPNTGILWGGDVGQGAREEVNKIELGGNYGWKIFEGDRCFIGGTECTRMDLQEPVTTYERSEGRSITGGVVYHGDEIPALTGRYLYGDFATGRLWALGHDPNTGAFVGERLIDSTNIAISSFGFDRTNGETYLIHYGSMNNSGSAGIFKLRPNNAQPPAETPFPKLLSQTGCMDPQDIHQPIAGLMPYTPNAPFWSDGVDKTRWLSIPADATILVDADGDFDFPNGTVLIKSFARHGKTLETRLFMRHDDGVWAGYSYAWREDQSDADLLDTGQVRMFDGMPWKYPARGECVSCHNAATGYTIGPSLAQINKNIVYEQTHRISNQLATWEHVGLFESPLNTTTEDKPGLVDPYDDSHTLNVRARSYLDTNCAYCHTHGGIARGNLDLSYSTPLVQTGLCDPPQVGSLDIPNPLIIAPGAPAQSILLNRMKRQDTHQMPQLGGFISDKKGIDLLTQWVDTMTSCP